MTLYSFSFVYNRSITNISLFFIKVDRVYRGKRNDYDYKK